MHHGVLSGVNQLGANPPHRFCEGKVSDKEPYERDQPALKKPILCIRGSLLLKFEMFVTFYLHLP